MCLTKIRKKDTKLVKTFKWLISSFTVVIKINHDIHYITTIIKEPDTYKCQSSIKQALGTLRALAERERQGEAGKK